MKKRFGLLIGCVLLTAALLGGCGAASYDGGASAPGWGSAESLPWVSDGENYQYDEVVEQGFCDVQETPSSYFSLDRNTAGYSFVRTQIRQGYEISPGSVRLEELVNYFD